MKPPPHVWAFARLLETPPPHTYQSVQRLFLDYPHAADAAATPAAGWQGSAVFCDAAVEAYHACRGTLALAGVDVAAEAAVCEAWSRSGWGRTSSSPALDRGYLYAASGRLFVDEANLSVASLKAADPAAHVTLVTDSGEHASPLFDKVTLTRGKFGAYSKSELLRQTPYRRTVFLDTDTFVCTSPRPLFGVLAYADVALPPARAANYVAEAVEPHLDLPDGYEFNSGLVAFRWSEAGSRLLQAWDEKRKSLDAARFESRFFATRPDAKLVVEQRVLSAVVRTSAARLHTLDPHWHVRFNQSHHCLYRPPVVLHGRLPGVDRNARDTPLPPDYDRRLRLLAADALAGPFPKVWRASALTKPPVAAE